MKTNTTWWRIVAICMVVAVCTVATGQTNTSQIITRVQSESLRDLMREMDFQASIDSDGDILWHIGGIKTFIIPDDAGRSLMFLVAFRGEGSLSKANTWNERFKFSRCSVREGSMYLRADLDLDGGITRERLKDWIGTCVALTFKFVSFLDEESDTRRVL